MAIVVIGPSGVGKSSALDYAARSLNECRFASLDRLTRDLGRERKLIGESEGINDLRQKLGDDEEFMRLGSYAVERLEGECGGHVVVDIGAGFLDASSAGDCVSAAYSRGSLGTVPGRSSPDRRSTR